MTTRGKILGAAIALIFIGSSFALTMHAIAPPAGANSPPAGTNSPPPDAFHHQACTEAATPPNDPQDYSQSPGVADEEVNLNRALEWCAGALEYYPEDPQLAYIYGRVLRLSGYEVEAAEWLEYAATNGYIIAQFELGQMYAQRGGADLEQAVRWYASAAAAGYSPAQFELGMAALGSLGTEQNLAEAVRNLLLASDQLNTGAIYELSKLYAEWHGVTRDPVKAMTLLTQAAKMGLEDAIERLAALQVDIS